MTHARTLEAAFLADHQVLTKGLHDLQGAAERADFDEARRLADRLDRVAGPHIEFEERFFYPRLVGVLSADFISQLYAEHDQGRQAIERLRDAGGEEDLDWAELRELLQVAMDHVLSCGTLTSHLAMFAPAEVELLRESLSETRECATRWTEIDRTRRVFEGHAGGTVTTEGGA